MNSSTIFSNPETRREYKIVVLLFILCGIASAIGFFVANLPVITFLILLLIIAALAVIIWPDVSTLVVVFLIYSNAPAIAVQFHGVPYVIGASIPFLLIIPLTYYLVFKRQEITVNNVFFLVFLFHSVQVVGALFSKDVGLASEALVKYLLEGLVLYFLLINVIRTKVTLHRVVWVLLIAGAFLGAISFYQQITKSFDNNYWGFAQVSEAAFRTGEATIQGDVFQPRLGGSLGQQNRFAQIMLMLVPLGLFRFWGERSIFLRVAAIIFTALISLGIATTFSRGAALGFAAIVVTMIFMRIIRFRQLILIIAGIFLIGFVLPQYGTRVLRLRGLVGLLSEQSVVGSYEPDGSITGRTTEMMAAALAFADHPIIGVGPGMFGYHYQDYAEFLGPRWQVGNRDAHDLYVGIAADSGLLGLSAFLSILLLTLRNLNRIRLKFVSHDPDSAHLATGFFLAIISYMATGIPLHFGYVRFFWIIMATANAACIILDDS